MAGSCVFDKGKGDGVVVWEWLLGGQLGLLYWLKCALQKLIRDVDSGRCRGV